MTGRSRTRRYLLTKSDDSYYPQVVADAGYSVWDWDASKLATLYQDSAKTTPVASNSDPVGAWVDGVQGVDAIQATTANKPTYTTATLGDLPTLSFDGGDLLATGNISISTFALWLVMDYASGLNAYSHQSVYIRLTSGAWINSNGVLTSQYNTIVLLKSPTIYRHQANGTHVSHKLYQNNVEVVGTPVSTADIGTTGLSATFNIGARLGLSSPITGNIAHLCIVSPYPTDASIIVNMESYINNLWSVY